MLRKARRRWGRKGLGACGVGLERELETKADAPCQLDRHAGDGEEGPAC